MAEIYIFLLYDILFYVFVFVVYLIIILQCLLNLIKLMEFFFAFIKRRIKKKKNFLKINTAKLSFFQLTHHIIYQLRLKNKQEKKKQRNEINYLTFSF